MDNYALAVRLQAAAMGVPFLRHAVCWEPILFRRSAGKEILCPFTGEKLLALPALYPDIAAWIHVHEADCFGNAYIKGTTVADLELAAAAKRLVITCERFVPHETFRADPAPDHDPVFLRGCSL